MPKDKHFDYIIIGAGSAGCVVANRLSQNKNTTLCLIETGGKNNSLAIKIPAGLFFLYGNKKYDYAYEGVEQKNLNNRRLKINRGKGMGGSSAINSMIYIRGTKSDYDNWEKLGCKGWSYDDVLPYFKDLEKNTSLSDTKNHGHQGELNVTNPQDINELVELFIKSSNEVGLPTNLDFNSKDQFGVGVYQVKQKNGVRVSSSNAFIDNIKDRDNLTIMTNTSALSLIIKNKTAIGIKAERNGSKFNLFCNKEVILCSGTIDSPRLLLASGIGNKKELNELGIQCQQDLPGVGKNLQDHLDSMVTVQCKSSIGIGFSWRALIPHILMSPFKYVFNRKGWLTTNFVEAGGFIKTKYADKDADIQMHFTPIFRSHRGKKIEFSHGYSIFTCLLRPKSTGSVKLKNDGSQQNILINHNFLADKLDEKIMIEAIKKAREILAGSPFDKIKKLEMAPGKDINTDAEILDYLRKTATTVYHPIGTCKMGVDAMAVVNPKTLKVYGIKGLRVIDASIMPAIISGNTSAPTMMIAAKAAKMILANN